MFVLPCDKMVCFLCSHILMLHIIILLLRVIEWASRIRLRDVMCYLIMTLYSTNPTAVYACAFYKLFSTSSTYYLLEAIYNIYRNYLCMFMLNW